MQQKKQEAGTPRRANRNRAAVTMGLLSIVTALFPVQSHARQSRGGEAPSVRLATDVSAMRASVLTGSDGRFTAPALGTYDIVALRVEFQPDTTRFTTGNGTFSASLFEDGLEARIDPEPHDAAYFEAHLEFLRNYISSVSDGRASLRTWLLPEVVTVPGHMGDYSPTGPEADSDAELSKLAGLVREAWSRVTSTPPPGMTLDPARTAFVLFHAGVGRDIELVGTSLDKTPEDLPSLFFSQTALQRLSPGAIGSFGGIPITNSLIIPRTETRRGYNFITDEYFLAEFSINGLLGASFLNFLGVPDLFDTGSGTSAVGPFDVMDGLGIFAMYGLFPPQPSAWTRAYLGWADTRWFDAVSSASGTVTFELPQAGSDDPASVLRVPVSDAEYFLVENRYRSADGVRLRVWKDGVETELSFANDDETFNPYTVEGFEGGVVLWADPYDFGLPGGTDENGNPLVGGALVWHVDERRLAETMSTNRVNADPERRSIDLEEADGAQDIGYASGGFFGPQFENGTPFDFWFLGNPVSVRTSSGQELRLYENRFGPDTVPSSAANDKGPSFVEIGEFSPPGEVMTVSVRRVSEFGIDPAQELHFPITASADPAWGGSLRVVPGGYVVHGVSRANGGYVMAHDQTGLRSLDGLLAAEPVVAGARAIAVTSAGFVALEPDGSSMPVGQRFDGRVATSATTPVVQIPGSVTRYAVGVVGLNGPALIMMSDGVVSVDAWSEPVLSLAVTETGELIVVGASSTILDGQVWNYPEVGGPDRVRPMFGRDAQGVFGVLAARGLVRLLLPDGSVVILGNDGVAASPATGSGTAFAFDDLSTETAVADLDGDGLLEAVVVSDGRIWAFHRTGAVAVGFPIRLNAAMGNGAPLVSNLTGAEMPTIIVGLADGTIDAFDLGSGSRRVDGFPLSVGAGPVMTPLLDADRIVGVDGNGTLRAWTIDRAITPAMGLTSATNASFVVTSAGGGPPGDPSFLMDPDETYNWPNPVQGGGTRIRTQVSEPANVSIRIIDLSGRLVDTIDPSPAPAGVPVEFAWSADVPSGVYIARVHAEAASGRVEDRLVKIAVIR